MGWAVDDVNPHSRLFRSLTLHTGTADRGGNCCNTKRLAHARIEQWRAPAPSSRVRFYSGLTVPRSRPTSFRPTTSSHFHASRAFATNAKDCTETLHTASIAGLPVIRGRRQLASDGDL